MKDWQRSPGPPSMMGLDHHRPSDSPESTLVDPAAILPRLTAKSLGGGRDAKQSLTNMCRKVIMRNIHAVQDLGDMPFRVAKDILEQCRIDQLVALEEASPHLLEHTDPIWKRNCLRDFIDLRKKYEEGSRKDPKSWRRAYLRKKGELEEQKEEAKQRIKDRYASHRAEKDAKKLVVSDRPLMKARGGRKFGGFATSTTPGTKGHSLLRKARSGSEAAARLTGGGNNAFRATAIGKAKAVGSHLQPNTLIAQRPMVAPKRVSGQSVRLKEAIEWNQKANSDSEDFDADEGRLSDGRSPKRVRIEQTEQAARPTPPAHSAGENPGRSHPERQPRPSSAASGASGGTTIGAAATPTTASTGSSSSGSSRPTINFFGNSTRSGGASSSPLNLSTESPSSRSPTKRPLHAGVTVTTSRMLRPATSAPTAVELGSDDTPTQRSRPPTTATRPESTKQASRPVSTTNPTVQRSLPVEASHRPSPQPSPTKRPPPPDSAPLRKVPPAQSASLVSASPAALSSIFMPRNRFTSQKPRS